MNGLKYIRERCNFSLGELSTELGISRQVLSRWENGNQPIPPARKQQLSSFFGVDASFFGEISEKQIAILVKKALWKTPQEKYTYVPSGDRQAYFFPTDYTPVDVQLRAAEQKCKAIVEDVESAVRGTIGESLLDKIVAINRGEATFRRVLTVFEYCFEQKSVEKMLYWNTLLDALTAIELAFTTTSATADQLTPPSPQLEAMAAPIRAALQRKLAQEQKNTAELKAEFVSKREERRKEKEQFAVLSPEQKADVIEELAQKAYAEQGKILEESPFAIRI